MITLPYTIHEVEQRTPEWYALRTGVITASKLGDFMTAEKSMQLDKKGMCEVLAAADIDHNPKATNEVLEKLIPNPERFYDFNSTVKKARLTLICKKLGEIAGETEDVWPNDAMKRGTALEPIAREQYIKLTKEPSEEVGFITLNGYPLGCSPDGIKRENGIIIGGQEIKAPQPSTHIRWLLDGGLPDEHKFQVHACMAITDAEWWDFFSFCPSVTEWKKEPREWRVVKWNRGHIPSIRIRVPRDKFTDQLKLALISFCGELKERMNVIADLRDKELKKEAA